MMINVQYGWKCPCCNVVYAPTVHHCRCSVAEKYGPAVAGIREEIEKAKQPYFPQQGEGFGQVAR